MRSLTTKIKEIWLKNFKNRAIGEETVFLEEMFHAGNGQEPPKNPDYMDPDTGETVPYETSSIPQEELVSTYLKKCNVNYDDEKEKNKGINYDGLNT